MLAFIPSFMLIATILSAVNAVAITLPNTILKQGSVVTSNTTGAAIKVAVSAPAVVSKNAIVKATKSHALASHLAPPSAAVAKSVTSPVVLLPVPKQISRFEIKPKRNAIPVDEVLA